MWHTALTFYLIRKFRSRSRARFWGAHYVFVIPVTAELDLKKAAKASGEKAISMIKQKDLLPLTGYVHGGCSPIGMKKPFKTFIHETALQYERMYVSAGKIGFQVELTQEDLIKITGSSMADVVTVEME